MIENNKMTLVYSGIVETLKGPPIVLCNSKKYTYSVVVWTSLSIKRGPDIIQAKETILKYWSTVVHWRSIYLRRGVGPPIFRCMLPLW